MTAAVCLFVKNEVRDLTEWVVHHWRIGFDRIIIYDNNSDDGTSELIALLGAMMPIDHYRWPTVEGGRTQFLAYDDCLARTRDAYDWVAFLDGDEFLIPYGNHTLAGLLHAHEAHGAFGLNWLIFGSSGLESLDGKLVMEAFTRRAPVDFPVNRHVKSFVRPRETAGTLNPHVFQTERPYFDQRGEEIVWDTPGLVEQSRIVHGPWGGLHHYFVRTRQHWERRLRRKQPNGRARDPEMFSRYDRNDEVDESALVHAAAARQMIGELGLDRVDAMFGRRA